MQAEPSTPAQPAAPGISADLWRAGCLDPLRARAFEQAMAENPELAAQGRYGRDLAQALHCLPELAARRRQPRAARRPHWPRLLAAGGAGVAVAGLALLLLPAAPAVPAAGALDAQRIQASPQLADAVQNLDFYEWLAAHPQALARGASHDGTA